MHSPTGIRASLVLWAILPFLLPLQQTPTHSKAPTTQQSPATQQEHKPSPVVQYKPHGYVNDFAGMIDSRAQSQLDLICKELDKKKRTQMAIVTVVSLEGLTIKEFATQLGNHWGVGYKDTNRGILILLSRDDRQYRLAARWATVLNP